MPCARMIYVAVTGIGWLPVPCNLVELWWADLQVMRRRIQLLVPVCSWMPRVLPVSTTAQHVMPHKNAFQHATASSSILGATEELAKLVTPPRRKRGV